jgi:hypothetical protein
MFLEFESEDVAKMVAKTMNNYLLVKDAWCVVYATRKKSMKKLLESGMFHFITSHMQQ